MWNYAHNHLELTAEEQAHISSCQSCLHMFSVCVNAEDPEKVDLDDRERGKSDRRSA